MEEKVKAVILGKIPCPDGYEVLDLGAGKWQIWNKVQNTVYCWVEKHGDKLEIIS